MTKNFDADKNYELKCDCSEDDRCGCTFPNNMKVEGVDMKLPEHAPGCTCTKEHNCGCFEGKSCVCQKKDK